METPETSEHIVMFLSATPAHIPKGIITTGFNATKILSETRSGSLKRTFAAYTVLLGLTAVMIGLYLGEFKILSGILHNYSALLP